MKTLIRDTIARIPGVRFWIARWLFFKPPINMQRFWGVFSTQAEAKAHIPRGVVQNFDNPTLSEKFDENVRDEDEHLVQILSGIIPEVKTVFDLGGSIGFSFYQYRSRVPYPPDLRWTICEFPFVNELGRRIALKRGESQLFFTDRQEDGNNTDVYLTCGALQYFDCPFADILAKLKDKPRHVLVNRIPLSEHSTFFTLQHSVYSVIPYRVGNVNDFISGVEALGYKLVDQWKWDRFCDIILRPDRFVRNYYGFYFVRI